MSDAGPKTVVVGMSGGVDSSVVACLLKKQGYNVVGLHMKNIDSQNSETDAEIVREICAKFEIKLYEKEYADQMQQVKDYFSSEYATGKTPNPCVLCNKLVKFKPFIEFADEIGADFFATGHYAQILHDKGKHYLFVAKDENKDQTYFLNQLSQSQLSKAIFPLGNLSKDNVRELAISFGLPNAQKKDSYDVCFLGSSKFKDFMSQHYPETPGDIVDENTKKTLGKHLGLNKYTIGQRKGLGIGGGNGPTGEAWFVTKKDATNNILFVAQGNDDFLFSDGLIACEMNWIPESPGSRNFECFAKFRYRQKLQKVSVEVLSDSEIKIIFAEKQRAITEGQFVVLYNFDDLKNCTFCLGGGKIKTAFKN